MAESYPIVEVRPGEVEDAEQMGTKAKFWFRRGRERWLFKEPRANTGEHWAEKVAAEIGYLLGVPCARVELADYQGKRGSASLSFADRSEGKILIHGNEMLAAIVSGYDKNKMHKQSEHTWDHILTVFAHLKSLKHLDRSAEIDMAGYVFLDALIGNVDRHHQNWGCLLQMLSDGKSRLTIAPSFDHASSLGRELLPEEAGRRLAENQVAHYVEKGRGGIYRASEVVRPKISAGQIRWRSPANLRAIGQTCSRPGWSGFGKCRSKAWQSASNDCRRAGRCWTTAVLR